MSECLAMQQTSSTTAIELAATRFWRRVDLSAGSMECWPWMGKPRPSGHGRMWVPGLGPQYAHRIAYELTRGEWPDGHVHHRCENPACCNPAHLELLPHGAHTRFHRTGAVETPKAACRRGHALAGDNLYITPDQRRQCRRCHRERQARRRTAQ